MATPPSETPGHGRAAAAPGAGAVDPLHEPLRLGALALDRRLFMAPMAGITGLAFRRSVRRWGAGLAFTEMISAYGVHYRNRRTLDYLACGPDEHPLGFQLFGADASVLADAAARCVAAGADLVDLNMACPMRKVVKTGAGAALLGDPDGAAAIVAAVVGAVEGRVPVTVKIRSGLREGDEAGRRTAPRLVAAGAAAVCIHPRTASQMYRGRADHAVTFALAAELPVPVIASGDVDGRAAALALLEGGAAAVMLARHAVGHPWLFAEILCNAEPPSHEARLAEVRRFTGEAMEGMGARSVGYLRQFWPRYRRAGVLDKELAHALMLAPDAPAARALLGM
ncbi:MAG: tRNA-dihydrouridine synthase family protein [Actinobacteria bacterium]|nr:tRNA-dihydrouridine synthase family protein [Actinomycetota bacterium]